jgi:hypothetical protein
MDRASWDTRISVEYLHALEDGVPLQAFPEPVYAKFFLREYAQYLGLDPKLMVAHFTDEYGPVAPPPLAVLPKKYEALGEEATRIPMALESGRQVPLPKALLTGRPRPLRMKPEAAMDTTPPAVRSQLRDGTRSRQVRAALVLVAVCISAVAFALVQHGGGSEEATVGVEAAAAAPGRRLELPLGGTRIFPKHRVVAFYGAPGTAGLGILGIGPQRAAAKLLKQASAYDRGDRPVLPAFEIIVTVASSHPGEDGRYRIRQSLRAIRPYLDAIRAVRGLLILDFQPGQADFMTEIRVYEELLREPDVGVALDPEWHVGAGQVPGEVLGTVDARTVNEVAAYLSGLVDQYHLPQKLLVVHHFEDSMIQGKRQIHVPSQVAVTLDVDGVGDPVAKSVRYQQFSTLERFRYGIKLYYEHDTDLMRPIDVLNLYPPPDLIVYQ